MRASERDRSLARDGTTALKDFPRPTPQARRERRACRLAWRAEADGPGISAPHKGRHFVPVAAFKAYAPESLACIAFVGKKHANNQHQDRRAYVDEGLVAEAHHGICELEGYEYARKPTQQ